MLKAEPPAPKIKILAEEIEHLFFKSCTKPMPSVDSAKILPELSEHKVLAAPIKLTRDDLVFAKGRQLILCGSVMLRPSPPLLKKSFKKLSRLFSWT